MRARRTGRRIAVAAIVAFGIGGGYALTAANTLTAPKAGDGTGAITGFAASSVSYTLNATAPGNIDAVAFTLTPQPASGATVKVKLVDAGTDWYGCTMTGANASCTTTSPQATVAASDELRLVVAE